MNRRKPATNTSFGAAKGAHSLQARKAHLAVGPQGSEGDPGVALGVNEPRDYGNREREVEVDA